MSDGKTLSAPRRRLDVPKGRACPESASFPAAPLALRRENTTTPLHHTVQGEKGHCNCLHLSRAGRVCQAGPFYRAAADGTTGRPERAQSPGLPLPLLQDNSSSDTEVESV